jgi:hypothetical protein
MCHLRIFHASSFELHDNALALHEYTRHERKKHSGFDGELDNFQQPELSSLGKLVRWCIMYIGPYTLIDRFIFV